MLRKFMVQSYDFQVPMASAEAARSPGGAEILQTVEPPQIRIVRDTRSDWMRRLEDSSAEEALLQTSWIPAQLSVWVVRGFGSQRV